MEQVPIIDVAPLVRGDADVEVGRAMDRACRQLGFFYVVGHGVDEALQRRLETAARSLFALDRAAKERVAMAHGGAAWRGWFPFEGELTSGQPDAKEGFYLGAELASDHPRVRAGVPLHGPNVFPPEVPDLRPAVLEYLDAMTALGHALVRGLALGLGLDAGWFHDHLTADPLVLFRIFRYPPRPPSPGEGWGVAEHTDYGLLTILRQDDVGGLQVHGPDGWLDAPPVEGSFVCNLGDMLERMTGGRYRSTPHRVRNTGTTDRLAFPFFFDPAWDAEVVPVPLAADDPSPARPRWDGADLGAVRGTYGEYLLGKVGKVFPTLRDEVLDP